MPRKYQLRICCSIFTLTLTCIGVSIFVLNHCVELLITLSHGVFSAVFYLMGMIISILQNRKKISGRFKNLFSDRPWVWPNHPTLNPSLLSTLSHCLCMCLGMSLGICSVLSVMMIDKANHKFHPHLCCFIFQGKKLISATTDSRPG